MTRYRFVRPSASALLASMALAAALPATAHDSHFRALLDGFEEVPAIWSPAGGRFAAKVDKAGTEIAYEFRYEGFENTVTQAHIHFAQKGVNGGIAVFLCSNLGNGPVGTPACPQVGATLTGTIVAASVGGPAAQGIQAGAFEKLLEAVREGVAYVNVHTTAYPGGEIRGQIR